VTTRERLIVTGYLAGRHYVRGTDPPYNPAAFPLDQLERYKLAGVPRGDLAIAVAAFAHYVEEGEDVAKIRMRQMNRLDRQLSRS
jgi:hypothetical protein